MPKTKASLLVIAATAVTGATLFLLPCTPKTAVRTAAVERGDLIRSTLMEGVVAYANEQPLIALQAGRVARVYVSQGQAVRAGDLLVSMDTSVQEQELAAVNRLLYEQETALAAFGQVGETALNAAQTALEARTRQTELRAAIASAQIRAEADGVVGAVYVVEGAVAGEGSLLGMVHGTGLHVVAAGRAEELANVPQGAAAMVTNAEGKALGAAVLEQAGVPEADGATGQTMQPLSFLPMEGGAWAGAEAGDRVVVELVCEVLEDQALVPVSAVDANDQVWFVDGGAATPVEINLALRNDAYVVVPQEWAGKRVVLLPETAALYPGCAVREARAR